MRKIVFSGFLKKNKSWFNLAIIIYSVQERVLDPAEDIKRAKTEILPVLTYSSEDWVSPIWQTWVSESL